jgi:hypothetical protein
VKQVSCLIAVEFYPMGFRAKDAIGWTLRATAVELETRCAG